jgi:DNA invertase Pin-like site-specific DNA recombinase
LPLSAVRIHAVALPAKVTCSRRKRAWLLITAPVRRWLMVHLLAAFAEHEREQISQRTKDALAAAKARGARLGRNGADRLAPAYRAEAVQRARQLAPVLAEMKSAGLSARQMAAELTLRGIQTPTGARWHAQTVLRMIDRAGC